MKRVLSLFLFLVAVACISVLNATQDTNKEGTPVPFTELDPKRPGPRRAFGSYTGISTPLRVVIRDREGMAGNMEADNEPPAAPSSAA